MSASMLFRCSVKRSVSSVFPSNGSLVKEQFCDQARYRRLGFDEPLLEALTAPWVALPPTLRNSGLSHDKPLSAIISGNGGHQGFSHSSAFSILHQPYDHSMEVDNPNDIQASASVQGCVTVKLHALVFLNVSEHWTRNKVKELSPNITVYGALLGKQKGQHVEIINSFELLLDEHCGSVNAEFYKTRESQCKQVYPDLDIVGWYTTGGPISETDEAFNRQMQELNESLLILKLDPIKYYRDQLPIKIYESVIDNDGRIHFRQLVYALETDEAERIGVNHVAKMSMCSSSNSFSETADHLLSSYHAIQMLLSHLQLIQAYVLDVSSGKLPIHRAHLRSISALTKRLQSGITSSPSGDDGVGKTGLATGLSASLCHQANDVCLTGLIACLTQGLFSLQKCMQATTQVMDSQNVLRGTSRMTASALGMHLG